MHSEPADTDRAGSSTAPGQAYGLLSLDGVDVALPLTALREVVCCPAELAALPTRAQGLLGAMELRSLVVPVVDLSLRTGPPPSRAAQVVVVVVHDNHLVGVLADRVDGIVTVADDDLQPVRADGPLIFSATFQHRERGRIVSVLDARALLHLPGVPSTLAGAAGGVGDTSVGAAVSRTLTVVRCGDHLLALDVVDVHTTLPAAVPRESVLTGGACRGTIDYTGREIALVDSLELLGLGQLPGEQTGPGLVLDVGRGLVVLGLSALVDLREVVADDVLPLPAFAVQRPELFLGLVDLDGLGQCLVVDAARLRDEPGLVVLGGLNTALDDSTAGDGGRPADTAGGRPYLAYCAGTELVTLIDQVSEIVPLPTTLTRTGTDPALLGVVLHRRAAVPVLCLATLLGREPRRPATGGTLLLVHGEGGPVGFAVDALRLIVQLSWQDDRDRPVPSDPAQFLGAAPLAEVGGTGQLLPVLDLVATAAAVQAGGAILAGAQLPA